jgi:hypothetical protein
MRRVALALAAGAVVSAMVVGAASGPQRTASTTSSSTPKWKVVRSVRGGFTLAVPGSWTAIPPDKSTPGVVLEAFDVKRSTTNAPFGVLVVVVPGSGRSLGALSASVLRAAHHQPVIGPVTARRIRLPAGRAEVVRYRVRVHGKDMAFADYALVVRGMSVMLSYAVPYAQVDAYRATFTRSADSFHVGG